MKVRSQRDYDKWWEIKNFLKRDKQKWWFEIKRIMCKLRTLERLLGPELVVFMHKSVKEEVDLGEDLHLYKVLL